MKNLFTVMILALLTACSTSGHFIVPEGSDLYINERPEPVKVGSNGKVCTEPFPWTTVGTPPVGGVPFLLKKNGEIIKAGRLKTEFRIESLIFPPFAQFFWPMGFNSDITYDLVNDAQEKY